MARVTTIKCDKCGDPIGDTEWRSSIKCEAISYAADAASGRVQIIREWPDLCGRCAEGICRAIRAAADNIGTEG